MRWCLFVLPWITLAGCGVAPEQGSAPSTPPAASPTATTIGSGTTAPSAPPSAGGGVGEAEGADAAPAAPAAVFDPSQAAADNYRAWLVYEMNSVTDLNRDFVAVTYPDGVFVCAQSALGASLTSIEETLKGTKGWTGTGAAAIIKGALNALCGQFNQGYQTFFDKAVDRASLDLGNAMSWSSGVPPFYETGFFMKYVCSYLQTNGSAAGLEVSLHSLRRAGSVQTPYAAAFIQHLQDDRLLRRATHYVVQAGCLGDHFKLNGYWTTA